MNTLCQKRYSISQKKYSALQGAQGIPRGPTTLWSMIETHGVPQVSPVSVGPSRAT